jgi:hypothetical protein
MTYKRITLDADGKGVVETTNVVDGKCIDCGDPTKTGTTCGIPWANLTCNLCEAIRIQNRRVNG